MMLPAMECADRCAQGDQGDNPYYLNYDFEGFDHGDQNSIIEYGA